MNGIKKFIHQSDKNDMVIVENYGHIIGVVIAILAYMCFYSCIGIISFSASCCVYRNYVMHAIDYVRCNNLITINSIHTKSIITKSRLPDADYVINPYVECPHKCIYCYEEFMKRFTGQAKQEWGDFIDIKQFTLPVSTLKTNNHTILLGSVTDPYNPFEKEYNVTKTILESFVNTSAHIDILTKSSLVLRDVAIIKKIPNARVGISLNTLDDSFRAKTEPYASSIKEKN